MITENKRLKMLFLVFSLLCVVAVGVCLINDLAISKSMTWSAYVLTSVPFAWLLIVPVILAKKNRLLSAIAVMTLTLLPYLFILNKITPGEEWFTALGLPLGITLTVSVWCSYLLIRFVRISHWYMLAVHVFLYGVVVDTIVEYFTCKFTDEALFRLDSIISVFACIVITALLAIVGYQRSVNKKITEGKAEEECAKENQGNE